MFVTVPVISTVSQPAARSRTARSEDSGRNALKRHFCTTMSAGFMSSSG